MSDINSDSNTLDYEALQRTWRENEKAIKEKLVADKAEVLERRKKGFNTAEGRLQAVPDVTERKPMPSPHTPKGVDVVRYMATPITGRGRPPESWVCKQCHNEVGVEYKCCIYCRERFIRSEVEASPHEAAYIERWKAQDEELPSNVSIVEAADSLIEAVQQSTALNPQQIRLCMLFATATQLTHLSSTCPYLWVHSLSYGCGKSQLLTLIAAMSRRAPPKVSGSSTTPAIRMKMEIGQLVFLDEADNIEEDKHRASLINKNYDKDCVDLTQMGGVKKDVRQQQPVYLHSPVVKAGIGDGSSGSEAADSRWLKLELVKSSKRVKPAYGKDRDRLIDLCVEWRRQSRQLVKPLDAYAYGELKRALEDKLEILGIINREANVFESAGIAAMLLDGQEAGVWWEVLEEQIKFNKELMEEQGDNPLVIEVKDTVRTAVQGAGTRAFIPYRQMVESVLRSPVAKVSFNTTIPKHEVMKVFMEFGVSSRIPDARYVGAGRKAAEAGGSGWLVSVDYLKALPWLK